MAELHPNYHLQYPTRVGPYVITGTLAMGGMAQVCSAVDSRSGREVVLKLILPNLAQEADYVAFFVHEGELGLRLRHPHLVETLDAGQADGTHYIALERLHGQSTIELLRQVASRRLSIPLGLAVRVVADAARGLHAAHEACDDRGQPLDVVHRDMTPHNLFICTSGLSKVLDFGIAKASSQHHQTRTGILKGKFAYLAPEQIRGEACDRRVDVFALGTVLYELLTQKPLFRGKHDAETLQRVLSLDIPSPEKVRRQVPAALAALAMRALQRDPGRRIPTAEALADSLEAVAAAELIDSSPEAVADFLAEVFPELAEPEISTSATYSVSTETPPAGVAPLDGRTSEALVALRAGRAKRTPWLVGVAAAAVVTAVIGLAVGFGARARLTMPTTVAASGLPTPLDGPLATPTPAAGLQPTPPSITPPVGVPAPRLAPAPSTPEADPPTIMPALAGHPETGIRFVGDGPFQIHVDGRGWPSHDGFASLPPGKHLVKADSPGWSRTLRVKLAAGEVKIVHARAGLGRLRIAASPWAEVSVDDKPQGTTPFGVIELGEGTHTVVLVNPELHVTVRRKIQIPPNREVVLKVDLFHGAP